MRRSKSLLLVGILMGSICGGFLFFHRGAISSLKRENSLLKQKAMTLSASEPTQVSGEIPMMEAPSVELLRLRAEVNQLRQQTAQVAASRRVQLQLHKRVQQLQEENSWLRDATNTMPRLPRIGAWLGVGVGNINRSNAPPEISSGVVVSDLWTGGPAHRSALKAGDFITAIDGAAVTSSEGLKAILATKRGGDVLQLTVWRTNEYHTIAVQSRDWPQ